MFERLRFDNRLLRCVPIDGEVRNFVRQVRGACMSLVEPTPMPDMTLLAVSPSALALVNVSPPATQADRDAMAVALGGGTPPQGAQTAAHCYCGHQFGSFAGQLGDGAAVYLGETVCPDGGRWELQLKGAGLTPFSRTADGRKVLRSTLREFWASEAMAALGIPTTRAASVAFSKSETVQRDPLYQGNVIDEPCAVVSRVAPTFIRFGSFEICKPQDDTVSGGPAGPSAGKLDPLEALFDYVATTVFPEVTRAAGVDPGSVPSELKVGPEELTMEQRMKIAPALLAEISRRTAELVAQWQLVGFCHGVLNTDNMSICGLTIDYGPYAFMENFDESFVCNLSDHTGRYSYAAQPAMCRWNLGKLVEAWKTLLPSLAGSIDDLVGDTFDTTFEAAMNAGIAKKLGLVTLRDKADDLQMWRTSIFSVLKSTGADMTRAFTTLTDGVADPESCADFMLDDIADRLASLSLPHEVSIARAEAAIRRRRGGGGAAGGGAAALQQVQAMLRLAQQNPGQIEMMFGHSADVVARSLKDEEQKLLRLDADDARVEQMKSVDPADARKTTRDVWRGFLERYASYVVTLTPAQLAERSILMRSANPRFILRRSIAQTVTEQSEAGDEMAAQELLDRLVRPYEDDSKDRHRGWETDASECTDEVCVSCSS